MTKCISKRLQKISKFEEFVHRLQFANVNDISFDFQTVLPLKAARVHNFTILLNHEKY
jgi:hypothetical protein